MTKKQKLLLGIAGFVLVIAAAVIAYNVIAKRSGLQYDMLSLNKNTDDAAADKQMAPDFSMLDMDGNNLQLSDLIANGKPIVLNFWASWCPPCKSEMPEFNKVYLEMGDKVQFVMLDLVDGRQETIQSGTKYIRDNKFVFPVFFDTKQEGAYSYGIRSIPTTLFIDRDGYVVTGVQGAINEKTLRMGIEMIYPD